MVVVLPAPLGPTNPVTCPSATLNEIPSRATADPKRLRRPVTSMVAFMLVKVRSRLPVVVALSSDLFPVALRTRVPRNPARLEHGLGL
jgi:hypothetical protein